MLSLRLVIASLLGVCAVAANAAVAGGGIGMPVQITKVVEGTAPPGAQYVVEITCGEATGEITFDGPGSEIIPIPPDVTCTITETETGGATQTTTAAECVLPPDFCTVEVTSATSATVRLLPPDSALFDVEVTFTNSFGSTPPAPPEPAPVVIEAAPTFTG